MKISAEMVRSGLEKDFSFQVIGHVSIEATLGKLLLAEPDQQYTEGQIYLTDAASALPVPKTEVHSLLLIVGSKNQELISAFDTTLLFPKNTSVFAIHNAVQDIFAHYESWDAEIHRILSRGSDVQAMIDVGTEIFGNPLILHDSNFTSIAVSTKFAAEPSLAPAFDSKRLPYLMRSDEGREVFDNEKTDVIPLIVNGMHSLYINLYQQSQFKYRLLLIELRHGLTATDGILLDYLSKFIQLAIGFVPETTNDESALPRLMGDILTGDVTDRDLIVQQLEKCGWQQEHKFICYKIFAGMQDFNNRALRFMRDRIIETFDEECCIIFEDSIVAFFNLSLYGGDIFSLDSAMIGFLQDNNLKVGVSSIFTGFEEFSHRYTQASIALRFGPNIKPQYVMYNFKDVVQEFLTESCTDKLPARMVCAPELLMLKEYDKEHHTEFYNTLYVYLKNSLHSVQAAKELFIHRSTFLYRLDRIQQITGLVLSGHNDIWYLLLSFKLLEGE